MFRKISFMIVIMFLITACGGEANTGLKSEGGEVAPELEVVEPVQSQPDDQASAAQVKDQSEQGNTADDSDCQFDRWRITPSVYTYPFDSASDVVIVGLAASNGSEYWGSVTIHWEAHEPQLVVSSGNAYEAFEGPFKIPELPANLFSGRLYHHGYSEPKAIGLGIDTSILPPGFSVRGKVRETWEPYVELHSLVFKVDKGDTVSTIVTSMYLACWLPEDEGSHVAQIEIDLTRDYPSPQFPTGSSFSTLGDPVEIDGLGTFQYQDIQVTSTQYPGFEEMFTLPFNFTNESGSRIETEIVGMIIGSDGFERAFCLAPCMEDGDYTFGFIIADPNQTTGAEIRFLNTPGVGNYKYFWAELTTAKFSVHDLPD